MADLVKTLYDGVLKSIEATFKSYAQTNDWTNTITNYMAANNIFTKTDELIGYRKPGENVRFYFRRIYDQNTEQELERLSELQFDPNTRHVSSPSIGGEVLEIRGDGRELFNRQFELMGGPAAVTGGVFPGVTGDVRKYEAFMEDREPIYRESMDIAFDYYRKHAKPLGLDPQGREWCVAKVPRTDSPFQFLDPREYDIGLANKFWGVGTAYYLIEPLFHVAKKAIISFNLAQTATSEKGKMEKINDRVIVLDPLISMQTNMAKKIQSSAGGMIAPLYPALFLGRPFLEALEDEFPAPIYKVVDEVISAVEGLFSPDPPRVQRAQARTYHQVPNKYNNEIEKRKGPELRLVKGGLSEAGPLKINEIRNLGKDTGIELKAVA